MDKKKRIELFRSMNSDQRKKLILDKMKAKNIKVGSGVPNKTYLVHHCQLLYFWLSFSLR